MKKFITLIVALFCSLNLYAQQNHETIYPESVDLDGLTVFSLNDYPGNKLTVYGHTSGAYSAGICRIILRSTGGNSAFLSLADRFNFTTSIAGLPEGQATPIVTPHALMFKLMKVDYGFEHVIIETKDGKSIGENITSLFGDQTVAVMAGTCYSLNK